MKNRTTNYTRLLSLLCILFSGQIWAASITQDITLQPGWNAIYVEIQPDEDRIDRLFSDIPVSSVWRWIPQTAGSDFIADPAEGLLSLDGWFGYFPPKRPEAFLTTLHRLDANQAYLVHVEGVQTHTLSLTGKPVFSRKSWAVNGFSLTGFTVSDAAPPSFGDYFENSPAHSDMLIYTLSSDGRWSAVSSPYGVSIERGEAYWVFTDGSSNWQGPFEVDIDGGTEVDFANITTIKAIQLANRSVAPVNLSMRRINGDATPLGYQLLDEATQRTSFPDLPAELTISLDVNNQQSFTFAVRRGEFTQNLYEEIIELDNGVGLLKRFLVRAEPIQAFATTKAIAAVNPYAGLWLSQVLVNGVSEAQLAGTTPTDVSQPFPMKFMFHVDASGQVKLLKEVLIMWKAGVMAPSADNPEFMELVQPGEEVLITNPSLIPQYDGVSLRDGQPVAVRHSTVAYDFNDNEEAMTGGVGFNQSLAVVLELDPQSPSNPFRHKYHPDHDNLDPQFLQYREEAFRVTRTMQLTFTPTDPSGQTPPDWGDSQMGGTFLETFSGLHKNPIFVSGEFRAIRISDVSALNQ